MNINSFKFDDIPFIEYPRFIKSKSSSRYYNFNRVITLSNYSRDNQLSNRSLQSIKFDTLIELDYFKLLDIPYKIYREVPIINTNLNNDSTRSYYLLDYFIPDLSLCIELDSDFHDPIKDKLKDDFLNSIGIKVYRIYDFQVNTKEKLEDLINYIKVLPKCKFSINYSELINEYKAPELVDLEDYLELIKPKWRPAVEILSQLYDIKNHLLNRSDNYIFYIEIQLDLLYKLIPKCEKKVRYYNSLINYLKTFNILLKITSRKSR